MVEDINNLLNSGEVPNLFVMDEKIEICDKMRELDKQRDKTLQVINDYKTLNNKCIVKILRPIRLMVV